MIAFDENAGLVFKAPDAVSRALEEQQSLSAVGRFSKRKAAGRIPSGQRTYSDLLPASPPAEGEQYAFDVDLDRCTGCKSCVAACHSLNGLDTHETWRSTGLLLGGTVEEPCQQTVTTACHHCLDPACMNGCPVKAYEKSPVTGIVKHLDDQCIGCKYCTLTCPYDVPTYSKRLGIVRKCDMCSERLAVGEAPACVQACPTKAIRIRTVDKESVTERSEAEVFLPAAPSPALTLPSTRYRTRRQMPANLLPADYHRVKQEEGHLPLVIMLVLTQLSVGTFLWDFCIRLLFKETHVIGGGLYAGGAFLLGMLALGASVRHLGRPQFAFRAVLGLRTSWLSREIVVFGLYAGAAMLFAASFLEGRWMGPFGVPLATLRELQPLLSVAVAASGVVGVFCSVMVYGVTQRSLWTTPTVGFKFFTTMLLLGAALIWAASSARLGWEDRTALEAFAGDTGRAMCLIVVGIASLKLLYEVTSLAHLKDKLHSPARRAAVLAVRELRAVTGLRYGLGAIGGVILPVLAVTRATSLPVWMSVALPLMSFLLLVLGELLERHLFFVTSVGPRMPGGPAV